jgi:hypothetical protein
MVVGGGVAIVRYRSVWILADTFQPALHVGNRVQTESTYAMASRRSKLRPSHQISIGSTRFKVQRMASSEYCQKRRAGKIICQSVPTAAGFIVIRPTLGFEVMAIRASGLLIWGGRGTALSLPNDCGSLPNWTDQHRNDRTGAAFANLDDSFVGYVAPPGQRQPLSHRIAQNRRGDRG